MKLRGAKSNLKWLQAAVQKEVNLKKKRFVVRKENNLSFNMSIMYIPEAAKQK
jgi:hypothetical protein